MRSVAWIMAGIWFGSFAFCIAAVVQARADIPDLFPDALRQVFDTFATPLGVVLGFIFSREMSGANTRSTRSKRVRSVNVASLVTADMFAVLATLLYCGLFDYLMVLFVLRHSNMAAVTTGYSQLRPYVAFVITGVVAFYFGKAQEP